MVRRGSFRATTAHGGRALHGFAGQLAAALPSGVVETDPAVMESYRFDQAAWVEAGTPRAVVFPQTTPQVQAVLRAASQHRVPVVPRGAGSGLSGGAAAVDGCLVVCLTRMTRILDVDEGDVSVVVEPGVINADVSAAVADQGLWYPPDPASKAFSTIGGNIATNAGGLCCVKYGVTRDYVLALDVVLADGRHIQTGRRTVKGVAGLDLTSLFVGSEGTLGIVTSARLRLRSAPPPAATAAAFFPTLLAAGRAVVTVADAGIVPSLVELLDRTTLRAVDDWKRMDLDRDAAALLLFQSDAPEAARPAELAAIAQKCDQAGASFVVHSSDPADSEVLLTARRLAFPALERLGDVLLDDVAVPRPRVPQLLAAIDHIAEQHGVLIGTFGHAGDGNLHPTIVVERGRPEQRFAAQRAFAEILGAALELGGTITGEHGVGTLKRPFLERELGADTMNVQQGVKRALDPAGLLNPGKAI